MNKAELIAAIAAKTGATKTATEAFLNSFIEVVKETVKQDEDVALIGFGTFKVTERAARNGRNPRTGKAIKIPASKKVKFVVGKSLKDAVN